MLLGRVTFPSVETGALGLDVPAMQQVDNSLIITLCWQMLPS
jgi:hypothetical protein